MPIELGQDNVFVLPLHARDCSSSFHSEDSTLNVDTLRLTKEEGESGRGLSVVGIEPDSRVPYLSNFNTLWA